MKILLAVDGSENSLRAAEYAARLMEYIPDSAVTIVYVDNLIKLIKTRGIENLPSEFQEVMDNKVKDVLERTQKTFSEKNISYNTKVLQDYDVAEAIAEYAEDNNFDQIIMGTRGLSNIKGIVMGSVSHKTLQLAHCPITLVK